MGGSFLSCGVLAFLMSLNMLVQTLRNPYIDFEKRDTAQAKRGLLILSAVIATALVIGALLYWVPLR